MNAPGSYRNAVAWAARWPARLMRSGYQPGRLIRQIGNDLSGWDCVPLEPGRAEFRSEAQHLGFCVQEQVDARVLLQIVSADFILRVATRGSYGGQAMVRHTGHLRRSGVEYVSARGTNGLSLPLLNRLRADHNLTATLLPLDFTQCQVSGHGHSVELRLRHFAASEVSGQLPRFTRYVRLHEEQREALLAAMRAFQLFSSD